MHVWVTREGLKWAYHTCRQQAGQLWQGNVGRQTHEVRWAVLRLTGLCNRGLLASRMHRAELSCPPTCALGDDTHRQWRPPSSARCPHSPLCHLAA